LSVDTLIGARPATWRRAAHRLLTQAVDRAPDPLADAVDLTRRWFDRSPLAVAGERTGEGDAAAFDQLYAGSSDPWNYASSYYEHRRHRLALMTLPQERYRAAYEPGCSTGVLSELLAPRCDRLVASDLSEAAVALARQRLGAFAQVEVRRQVIPADWPDERFDLVVLADVGVYLTPGALDEVLGHVLRTLEPGGTLLAVHGRWRARNIYQTGDDVHRRLRRRGGLRRLAGYRDGALRVDAWERRSP
jgi:SAM-dependent methyltransferase